MLPKAGYSRSTLRWTTPCRTRISRTFTRRTPTPTWLWRTMSAPLSRTRTWGSTTLTSKTTSAMQRLL
ncbi:hypothetical protein GGF44_006217, partial [Coemansia sp. RSA 1694]